MAGANAHGDPIAVISTTRTAVSVNSSVSGAALAANTQRRWALFINDSTTVIYLAIATSTGVAVANKGIRLNSDGGAFEMSPLNGNLDVRTVHAIATASTGNNLLVAQAS